MYTAVKEIPKTYDNKVLADDFITEIVSRPGVKLHWSLLFWHIQLRAFDDPPEFILYEIYAHLQQKKIH